MRKEHGGRERKREEREEGLSGESRREKGRK
jgi:hypothetical protein